MKEEVSLRDLTALIKQRLGTIIGFGLIGLLLSVIYTFLVVTPLYESHMLLLVNRASDEANGLVPNDINSNVKMINTYKDIIEGPVILGGVIEELGLVYSVEELANQVTISAKEDSQVFSLAVTSPDPDESARIANEIAYTFQGDIGEIMSIENVKIISTATADNNPVSPHILNNLLIGLGVGVLAGFGAALLRYAMAKTIDDYQFVTQTIGWPNLGVVSELNKDERTAIIEMKKAKLAGAQADTQEGIGTAKKRIPSEEKPPEKEQPTDPVKKEPEKQQKKSNSQSAKSRERLATVSEMTREKIGTILQNESGRPAETGNKRGRQ